MHQVVDRRKPPGQFAGTPGSQPVQIVAELVAGAPAAQERMDAQWSQRHYVGEGQPEQPAPKDEPLQVGPDQHEHDQPECQVLRLDYQAQRVSRKWRSFARRT